MLDQMAEFDLRNAKCTLETDRRVIEEQVLSLWDEALEPTVSVAFGAEDVCRDQEDFLLPKLPSDVRHITGYPDDDQIINQFNAYVRGPLRDSVVESMGKEDDWSFRLCLVATMPYVCLSVLFIMSCDGCSDCAKSASYAGFSSVWQYTMTNLVFWVCLAPLVLLIEFQLVLKSCNWVSQQLSETSLRMLLGSCLCTAITCLGDKWLLLQQRILVVTVA